MFDANCAVMFNNNTASQSCGGSIYSNNSNIVLKGNSSLQFNANVAKFGGAVYTETRSTFTVENNSSVIFNSNEADLGGAIYITGNSTAVFEAFYYSAINEQDEIMLSHSTYIQRSKSMTAIFSNNRAIQGGAIYVSYGSIFRFRGASYVIFIHNKAKHTGGALNCHNSSNILFEGKSYTIFTDNNAEFGGAVCLEVNATLTYKGNSLIEFIHNDAVQNGGAVLHVHSKGTFQENSTVKFIDNTAKTTGGGAFFISNSNVTFDKYSTCLITFHNNKATQGGAICTENNSNITIGGHSHIMFTNNNATFGGAIYCSYNSIITTKGNSITTFTNNTALNQGGALIIKQNSDVRLKEVSIVIFDSNKAILNGGSVLSEFNSKLQFEDHCTVTFDGNTADDGTGGAISINTNSIVVIKGSSTVMFYNNSASQGGALKFYSNSFIIFQGNNNSTVIFSNNKATQNGGAIYLRKSSKITFEANSTVKFHSNEATLGGAINCNSNSNIISKESANITFLQNIAKLGGAIYTVMSNITITDSSHLTFTYNTALQDGGALFLDKQFTVTLTGDANITFSFNTASDYGGAIYSRVDQSLINFNVANIYFDNNHARTAGHSVFINVPTLCNSSCLHNSILGVSEDNLQHNGLSKHITTSSKKLVLYKPAQCIDNSNVGCDSYYIKNIMLGQEILIDACMYDYYDRSTSTAEFLITSADNQDYYISGSKYIFITCNHTFQGISIIGNSILPFNYSMTIASYVVRISEMKSVSLNITVGLSPCHPGFWYDDASQKCECHNSTSIVFCSGSSSTIKRGYWFGSVSGKPVITFCPINYCNFTCCDTTNGYYHLSPLRGDQCMLHRSGTACGSCEVGYSLSFDSTECIHVNECTVGQTILLVTLIILYWIAIVVVVFVMMYFKVEIGYLYGITYYYSIVDILLSQNWFLSNNQLYTLINVMSSITKITPQFLGHMCLVQGMSGIDQQFLHYLHPLAVSFILVVISCLARRSRRLSSFISRGIIPFICFLLLLSYTSVATTSLLLLRSLTFLNVDKLYTYLSPEVEYFHGRHLVYSIVAVLASIVIVISLPFLLLFEPFLNRKINFVRIKPLLDQFQGCYRDKFRYFAAYYMICRLVITVIIIVNSPNDFTTHYLIIIACVIMDLIHQISKPYVDNHLNLFDGVILHLTILVSFLPLVEFFDSFDLNVVIGTAYVLVLLPLFGLITMKLLIHRRNIKKMINYCSTFKCKHSRNNDEIPLNDCQEQLLREVGVIVDDNMRRNAIIVDV